MHAVNQSIGAIVKIGLQLRIVELVGPITRNDHRLARAADAIVHLDSQSPLGTQIVIALAVIAFDRLMSLALSHVVYQFASYRHFLLGFLAERDTDGVAQTLGHEGANAHGALDTAILAKSGLGHAQMQREMHILLVHSVNQTPNCLDHDHDIGSLHRDDDIHKLLLHKDTQELHHALDHTSSRVAIAAHDAVAERAVIHAQTHSSTMFTAHGDKGQQFVMYAVQFSLVFLVGIIQPLERAGRIDKVAGVDADAFTHTGCRQRCLGVEMNVGNEGNVAVM